MKTRYHIEITQDVLGKYFSQDTLKKIIRANVLQDRIKLQFGHDFIHFDSSTFVEGFEYISQQQQNLHNAVGEEDYHLAWKSLGRILHSWQDFYSHSNYIDLWFQKTKNPKTTKIDFEDQEIMNSPSLMSGKNYGLIEFIAMIPGISKLIRPLMPPDSHAAMNLDGPKSGLGFQYAYSAAEMRTEQVIKQIFDHIKGQYKDRKRLMAFTGNNLPK